jgi:hypothetical protein
MLCNSPTFPQHLENITCSLDFHRGIPLFAIPHLPTAHTDAHLHPFLSLILLSLCLSSSFFHDQTSPLYSFMLSPGSSAVLRPGAGGMAAWGGAAGGNLPVVWTRPPAGAELGPRPWGHRWRSLEAKGVEEAETWVGAWPWWRPRASSVGRPGAKAVVGRSSLCSCDRSMWVLVFLCSCEVHVHPHFLFILWIMTWCVVNLALCCCANPVRYWDVWDCKMWNA